MESYMMGQKINIELSKGRGGGYISFLGLLCPKKWFYECCLSVVCAVLYSPTRRWIKFYLWANSWNVKSWPIRFPEAMKREGSQEMEVYLKKNLTRPKTLYTG